MSFGSGYPLVGGMRWLRPALSGMLFLVAGAIAVVEVAADSGKKLVSENAGSVCFWRGYTESGAEAMFRPALGCLSSSCTLPLEQSFSAVVRDGEIAMTSRFVVTQVEDAVACTADCGGAGGASSKLTRLRPGSYRVTLGGTEIGVLDTARLEGDPFNRICFGNAE